MSARNASCSCSISHTRRSSAASPIPRLRLITGPAGCSATSGLRPRPWTGDTVASRTASEDTSACPLGHSVSTSTTVTWVSAPSGQISCWSGTPGAEIHVRHQRPCRTGPYTLQCPPWSLWQTWRLAVGPGTCPSSPQVYEYPPGRGKETVLGYGLPAVGECGTPALTVTAAAAL